MASSRLPAWAEWNPIGAEQPWTVGIEEEVMLLDPATGDPVSASERLLAGFDETLAAHASPETHGCALELATGPHRTARAAAGQLADLRGALATAIAPHGVAAGVAGTHPTARMEEVEVSPGARYQFLHASLRELARREPTFALHVHVAVPEPEQAVRALNGLRAHLPVLLALSANSPFWRGRDSGLASARTPLFQAFPRVGLPRAFADYADYVQAIESLLSVDAIPEPTFIWWDARLQPRLGTIEVRVMDAQTRLSDAGALAALVQCLVRLEATTGFAEPAYAHAVEVLEENRFLAARDGIDASLIDPVQGRRRPVASRLAALVDACRPHAAALGCWGDLTALAHLAGDPGAPRQRAVAAQPDGLLALTRFLQDEFARPRPRPVAPPVAARALAAPEWLGPPAVAAV